MMLPLSVISHHITLTGVQGYSGQVAATATAPSVLVHWLRPTKNSRPVKSTSEPESRARGEVGSTTVCPSSLRSTAFTFSTCNSESFVARGAYAGDYSVYYYYSIYYLLRD